MTTTFGVTIHTQTGEMVKIHNVECRHYQNAKKKRELTAEEAVTWLKDRPTDVCSQCITRPANALTDEESPDPVDHILAPASKLLAMMRGETVKAVCGQVIRHKTRRGAPICRKCFDRQFGK